MPLPEQFPYGEFFQLKLVALCLRSPKFVDQYSDVLDPKYFDRPAFKHLVTILRDYSLKYRAIPNAETTQALIFRYVELQKLPEHVIGDIRDALYRAVSIELDDEEYIRDEAVRFARRQSLREAISVAVDMLDNPDSYEAIERNVRKALTVGSSKDPGFTFRDVAKDIPSMLQEGIFNRSNRVTTGVQELDDCLAGGLGPGELGVILAPPGAGKSMVMTAFGAAAIRAGHNVFHYTLELKAPMVLERYAANLTGIPINDIRTGDPSYAGLIDSWTKTQQTVQIKYFSPYSVNMATLRSHVSYTIAHTGIKPSLLIVDYLDLLDTGNSHSSAERSGALGRAYAGLIALGDEFECACWSPSQVAKEAWDSEVIKGSKVSFSAEKIHHADAVFALCQTDEEKRVQELRMYTAKARMDEGSGTVHNLIMDTSRSRLISNPKKKIFGEVYSNGHEPVS